jgi:hypothetical protein
MEPDGKVFGHLLIPGKDMRVSTYGKVYSTETATGAELTVAGPGRIVVDIMR